MRGQSHHRITFLFSWIHSPSPSNSLVLSIAPTDHWAKVGMLLGAAVGLVGGGGVAAVAALTPHLLTQDPLLWPFMGQVVVQVFISMVFTGVDVCGCAINIAVSYPEVESYLTRDLPQV